MIIFVVPPPPIALFGIILPPLEPICNISGPRSPTRNAPPALTLPPLSFPSIVEKFPIEKLEKQVFEKVGIDILGFGLPDARLGEELGLLIKRRREAPQITMENVYDTLKELTDRDFAQKAIVVDDFPLSQTHKVDRKKARILYLNETKDSFDIILIDC